MRAFFLRNRIWVGLATFSIALVLVFLAYRANRGIPFQSTYEVTVSVPDAAGVVAGNDVRIGGARVGTVDSVKVRRLENGGSEARMKLNLAKSTERLPVDSTVIVRQRSLLGAKYVELTRGRSRRVLEDHGSLALAAARPRPVELDQVLSMFDAKTRQGVQRNLGGFGEALAGRGVDINLAIGSFRPLLRDAPPVLENLTDPDTELDRFIANLGRTFAALGPVANQQGELFANLNRTMTALASVSPSLQASLTEGEQTLSTGISTLPQIRPFLRNTTGLMRELRPGARALRRGARPLANAISQGAQTLKDAPEFNRRLERLLRTLQAWGTDPQVNLGLMRLAEAMDALDPTLKFIAPAQTRCNYLTLLLRNASSVLSQGGPTGTWQRFMIVATPQGPNNEGVPSAAPANGPGIDNHLHSNPYPYTAAPGQPLECEAGNERYLKGQTIVGNVPGRQRSRTEGNP